MGRQAREKASNKKVMKIRWGIAYEERSTEYV